MSAKLKDDLTIHEDGRRLTAAAYLRSAPNAALDAPSSVASRVPEAEFPPGTPVYVMQSTTSTRREGAPPAEVVGVVEAWEELPTGSWYAHGKKDRLWLKRLRLRKVDGEITLLVVDDSTVMAKLEPAP